MDDAVEVRLLCRTSSSGIVLIYEKKQPWNLLVTNMGSPQEQIKSRWICVQAYAKFFRPHNKTTQEKVVTSRSDCAHGDGDFFVDSGASLHKLSKNELTCGDKDTIRRSRESTVNTTASGKAESTEEARVYVNDLVVSVTMVLLEDLAAVVSLGLLGEELGCTCGWKRECLHL